jgi:hypothetical protein
MAIENPNTSGQEKPLTPSQLKAGDVLIRENDHIDRPDHRVKLVKKHAGAPTRFDVENSYYNPVTAKSLCAQGYGIVERNGQRIGTFFTKYW